MFVSGNFGADDVATGVLVEQVNQLFDGAKHAPQERNFLVHLAMTNCYFLKMNHNM
jgi:hypothetical protein